MIKYEFPVIPEMMCGTSTRSDQSTGADLIR